MSSHASTGMRPRASPTASETYCGAVGRPRGPLPMASSCTIYLTPEPRADAFLSLSDSRLSSQR